MSQCSCTENTDCDRCKLLEKEGDKYIEANGAIGIALLARERDALIETNKKAPWAVYDPVKNYMTPTGEKSGPMLIGRFTFEHHAVMFQQWYFEQIKKLRPVFVSWDGGDING